MNNPPTKRSNGQTSRPHDNCSPPTQIAYRGLVQAHHTQTTQSVSIQDTEGTTTTTTTQTSQTVTAMIEARFQTIEAEMHHQKNTQLNMNSRLHTLEHRTESIDSNIAEMMKFWKIAPTQKRKASDEPTQDNIQIDNTSRAVPHPTDVDMDAGDLDQCL